MSHHGIHTLEGTERYLVTRRIVPSGEANLFDELPEQIRKSITEVHYVDGRDPANKGLQGTYGVDLPAGLAAKFERATNLVDLIKIADHGMGFHPDPDLADQLISESPLSGALDERFGNRWGGDKAKWWKPGWTLDQGREGACVGFSCTQMMNAEPVPNSFDNRYAQLVYYRARQIDPWPGEDYEGTSVQAGMQVFHERGLIARPGWTNGFDELVSWVSNVGPIVFGMDWHEGMHRPDHNGFIHPTGNVTGGHAILCNGRLPDLGGFDLQNSWGAGWGINGGFCRISNQAIRELMGRGGFIAGAMLEPVPAPPDPKPPEPEPPKPDPDDPTPPEYRPGVHRQGLASFNRDRGELFNQEHIFWVGRKDKPVEIGRYIPKHLDK